MPPAVLLLTDTLVLPVASTLTVIHIRLYARYSLVHATKLLKIPRLSRYSDIISTLSLFFIFILIG